MSTVISKGIRIGSDPAAETWLAATDLAGNPKAIAQLSRAVSPRRYGFTNRRALNLDGPGDSAEAILALLHAHQVPTADAVDAMLACPGGSPKTEKSKERHELLVRGKAVLQGSCDSLGESLSSAVADYWINYGRGPTWREAWTFAAIEEWWTIRLAGVPPFWLIGQATFGVLHRAGWLASNNAVRSLCPGRRFYTRFYGDHVSGMSPDVVGFGVARFIGIHRRRNDDRSPDWPQIAAEAVDPKGVSLFFNAADAQAQQQWLVTTGWIRLDDAECLRRGERAKARSRRHAVATDVPEAVPAC
ncbi:hypothetical protein ACW9HQ_35035 [Nocardia gipuzkoensis]